LCKKWNVGDTYDGIPKEVSMLSLNNMILSTVFLLSTGYAHASVMVRPGQCIIVGTTEVCASLPTPEQCTQSNNGQVQVNVNTEHSFICRYAMHPNQEVPNIKTYALIRTTTNDVGRKEEMMVKNYGIKDKAGCEAEADKRNEK
jgi:hypothetical protein